jgi:hypothetical protein
MAVYGSFPGVRIETQSGGIASISIGEAEKIVLFGESNYDGSNNVAGDDASLSISAAAPEQIAGTREADAKFGSDSELANAMKEALANGANISFLYGVAVPRESVTGESISGTSGATGTLNNVEIVEDTSTIALEDSGGSAVDLAVEFRYNGAPSTDGGYAAGSVPDDTIFINPLTGEYAMTSESVTTTPATIDYTHNDYSTAFSSNSVLNVVNEDETGIFVALSDSDSVSSSLNTEVSNMRTNYKLVNALSLAEPNDNELLSSESTRGGADARYDTANYGSANQSVSSEYFFKFAPGRQQDSSATIGGGLAGLFGGNPISDPIYNEALSGYQGVEQTLSKSEADDLRAEDIIPIRQGGSIRVQGNRSTAFSESDSVAADFWVRRITDRVILIGKGVGDEIIGRINDEETRTQARRLIENQLIQLVDDRLIRSNEADETYWSVEVFEDSTNPDEVNIDISFTPYGIVKRVDETIIVDTS